MFLYIDESGNFGWPLRAGSEPFMLFTILLIEDRQSKRAISQAVSRAIVDLRKHHPAYRKDSKKRIPELKGSKEFADRSDVGLRFFKLIVRKAKFRIYAVILDKRNLRQEVPASYMERYSMLLLNILYAILIPKNQRWVTMVVDSQAKADPTQPRKERYNSKDKRLCQKKLREQDRRRRNQYTQMITSVFKRVLKPKGTHLKVWHVRSHEDRCLQAVDVIGHFMYQRLRLDEERKKLYKSLSPRERRPEQLEKNKQWQELKKKRDRWFQAYEVLKPNYGVVRRPNYLRRYTIEKLARHTHRMTITT